MAYINSTELGQLSAIPTAVLTELETDEPGTIAVAIDAATSDANGYLASRYELPLSSPGKDVKQRVADIAAYRLMSRHGYSATNSDEDIRQRYEDAVAWFKDVARGLVTPDIPVTVPTRTKFARATSRCPRGW